MPYRIRYALKVDYFAAGQGLGQAATDQPGDAWSGPGGGYIFPFYQSVDPASNTFTNADVGNLLTAMYNDLEAQLTNVTTQTAIQNAGTFSAVPPPGGA